MEYVIRKQSHDTAALFGLTDRGVIEVGKKADIDRRLATARRRLRNTRRPDVTVLPAPTNVHAEWTYRCPFATEQCCGSTFFAPGTMTRYQ